MKTKFKVGDKVRCIKPKVNSGRTGTEKYGAGWEEGLIFTITRISTGSLNTIPILWGGKRSNGVYEDCVSLPEITDWRGEFQ